ncbi:MAG: hypothetical protein KBB33_04960 [Candidatus Cloacimonetes bacterium]|nr:hypothetical protein [Candidatus Cloacimonadota bacterium]HOA29548.1 hypothetical protein [Candidatus Cloacimonadota bacterium]HOH60262.1 hypothetical protein [Candidatus Cloacimonadota bacterium]HPI25953.1 hypothetical protein [Candidatus Cloacimonadota bacterium]
MNKLQYLSALLVLAGCAHVDNANPMNAVPLTYAELTSSSGISSSNNVFMLGAFAPDSLNSDISSSERNAPFAMRIPATYELGMGRGFSLFGQAGIGMGPTFEPPGYEEIAGLSYSVHVKGGLKKSIRLSDDTFVALLPAYGFGTGISSISDHHRLRYRFHSYELPLTLSRQFHEDNGIILSSTLRVAWDMYDGDINRDGFVPWSSLEYPDQPRSHVTRYAAMAHTDLRPGRKLRVTIQAGAEYSSGKKQNHLLPILYLGLSGKPKFLND